MQLSSSNGETTVPVRALATGASYNITTATKGSFMAGFLLACQSDVVLTILLVRQMLKSDSSLLERLLEIIRRPPAGGNRYDYRIWALSVDGVDAAYVYPLRRGLGTVDIAITSNNEVPSDETVQRCQTYIDDVRPVTARESKVVKPDVTKSEF